MDRQRVKTYYSLMKPGVLYGNVLTSLAGFLLAAGFFRRFDIVVFVATMVGTTLVIGAACVLNNVLDRDIDQLMERTKGRAVASGAVAPRPAMAFSAVLGIVGIVILALWVNWLVVAIGLVGFVVYVWLYGALSKRLSIHGTLVGSISGAMPILAGYCALADRIDLAAVLLFLMLFFWQFPEFFSIAIYRRKEYKTAGVPVITVVKGVDYTIRQIQAYTIAFVIATLLLFSFGYVGYVYFIVMGVAGGWWLNLALNGRSADDQDAWARRMFHMSLNVLLLLCLMLAVGPWLP